jgi:hypothetical protein
MKKNLLTLLLAMSMYIANAAVPVHMTIILPDKEIMAWDVANQDDKSVVKTMTDLKKIAIKATLAAKQEIWVTINKQTFKYQKTNSDSMDLDFDKNIIGAEITVEHYDLTSGTAVKVAGDDMKFHIINNLDVKVDDGVKENDNGCAQCDINAFVEDNYSDQSVYLATPFGIYEKRAKTIHIFFDQYGNSVLSTIPQGIANATYVVHIIYPIVTSDPDAISYSVKQKSGSFNGTLLFNNSDIKKNLGVLQAGIKYDGLREKKFLLGTATDDLTFDIVAAYMDGGKAKKDVIDTYTIKMSPMYHGSFDIGLLRTDLNNPTFSLVQSPTGTGNVIKQADSSPRGIVTVMATYYVSPIILLESLFANNKNPVPFYKLTGRNFLDDHKFYERIYPAIGVSISSKAYENLFYGFNFEIARGLDFFAGWHYGKVNVFEMPDFIPGKTAITQQQYDFYTNTKWKTSGTFGLKIDPLIIKNLFGSGQ